ncbi:IS21 family transposase [Alkalimarinus coralli]|uniref:IS21 family transposase n=1 Tax=Alkalimarinus coralli TaxID=2935863 RepID=UPI00202B6A5A|nr:IS21 family transposase [Alkalimarinus coralli]
MLTQEKLVEIHVLHRQGMSIRKIAKELNVSRNTVRKYLRDVARTPTYNQREPSPSKLDAFKPYLKERIDAAKPNWIPATVLCREIQAMGYQGKEGILKNYIRQFKPKVDDPVVRFETASGQQMQVDFTTICRGRTKLKAFVATLGYSRASYVRFSEYERQEDWLAGIEGALHYFGGVPQEMLFDNAKCIMIERDAFGEGQHRWNASLLVMARDYGFRLRACRPYRAKTKGKVERFNGYLKNSFITPLAASLKQAGLTLDIDIANAQVGPWLADIAHQRIHGTTGEKPQVLLDTERLSLMPLPSLPESASEIKPHDNVQAIPVESLQHPLSTYDQLLGVAL